jgi:hypothetical protein
VVLFIELPVRARDDMEKMEEDWVGLVGWDGADGME